MTLRSCFAKKLAVAVYDFRSLSPSFLDRTDPTKQQKDVKALRKAMPHAIYIQARDSSWKGLTIDDGK